LIGVILSELAAASESKNPFAAENAWAVREIKTKLRALRASVVKKPQSTRLSISRVFPTKAAVTTNAPREVS
jgi:hypothetical protein